jgi:hypothetical protein
MNKSALAIAATTATLQGVLSEGLGGANVTVRPLDTARNNTTGDQINLFLYQVLPDAAWRNLDIPHRVHPGETAPPPLPLTLYYLITAFGGDNDNDIKSHALLGKAMSVLHDYPVIGADKIKKDIDSETANLNEQVERIRITLQPLTFEEISKLWTTFQTHYRTSAAYQVSVVLIESMRAARAPLPVLRRGEEDRGVTSQPDLVPPFPALTSAQLPERQFSAQPGDVITLRGSRLSGGVAHLASLRFPNPTPPTTTAVNDTQLDVMLPANLAAGFYTIAVRLTTPKGEISSNELPLAVAPVITTPLPLTVTRAGGVATINLACSVPVLIEQRVLLLLGDYEAQAEPPPPAPPPPPVARNTFQFIIKTPAGGRFPTPTGVGLLTRLRVDGIDSEIIAPRQPGEPENAPPRFDQNRKITIN